MILIIWVPGNGRHDGITIHQILLSFPGLMLCIGAGGIILVEKSSGRVGIN
jgi:hypothetical protein